MELRILGPLEVVIDGTVRTLPAGGERAVLQVLALNAGRIVPASTLVDALWGEELPANTSNALQGRVSRLRNALGDAGIPESAVITRRPGYLLDIDPERVDAHRFVRLIRDARRQADRNAAVEAIALYEHALALWRGEPLAEFSAEPWAQAEINRLTALRTAAIEERVDLRLVLGHHSRTGRGVGGSHRPVPAAGTTAWPAHAGSVPVRPAGRLLGRLPAVTPHPRRPARAGTRCRGTGAGTGCVAPGRQARRST